MNKLKVLSLFSGIGAWEKALKRLGIDHELIAYCENDSYPAKAYSLIHNVSEDLNLGDATRIDTGKLEDFDMMVYSPPCQSFSVAGRQLGFEDKRGILFFDALKVIKAKKPKYALMENVKGLTQKKFKDEFEVMLKELENAGYKNYWKVLNARWHGIPQNRERLFIISIRNDIEQEFEFPKPISYRKQLSELIETDAELPILHNIYGGFKEKKPRVFEEYSPTIRTSAGGGHIPSICVKGCSLRTRRYAGKSQQLEIRKDDVSNAITTVPKDSMITIVDDTYKGREAREYDEYPPAIRSERSGFKVVDGHTIRTLSSLECFRLMDFEDRDHEILKENGFSKTRLYKMAGNSIVVGVIEEIFKELFK